VIYHFVSFTFLSYYRFPQIKSIIQVYVAYHWQQSASLLTDFDTGVNGIHTT